MYVSINSIFNSYFDRKHSASSFRPTDPFHDAAYKSDIFFITILVYTFWVL